MNDVAGRFAQEAPFVFAPAALRSGTSGTPTSSDPRSRGVARNLRPKLLAELADQLVPVFAQLAVGVHQKEILKELHNAVTSFEEEDAVKWAKIALEEGVDLFVATMSGLADGMIDAGEKYNRKEDFVPELLLCSDALYAGLAILRPAIEASGRKSEVKGSIVLGVVEGDVHDIGKNLVKLMFQVAGWTVYDLGKDVPLDKFVEEMIKTESQVVGISALMTTSMLSMPEVIKKLRAKNPQGPSSGARWGCI